MQEVVQSWANATPLSCCLAPLLDIVLQDTGLKAPRTTCGALGISLGDIQNVPTRWVLALFPDFLNFRSDLPKLGFRRGGGGIIFEICEKRLFQKCMA